MVITIICDKCRFLAALRYCRLKLPRLRETKNTHMVTLDLYLHATPFYLRLCCIGVVFRLCFITIVFLFRNCGFRTWEIRDSRSAWNLLYAVGDCWWHWMACFGHFDGNLQALLLSLIHSVFQLRNCYVPCAGIEFSKSRSS